MDGDAKRMRGPRPFTFTNLRIDKGVREIGAFILEQGGIPA
jgi:urease accessory protein